MDDIDRIGRQAAEGLLADVHRRVDVEEALRRMRDPGIAPVVPLDRAEFGDRDRPRWRWVAVAAAAVLLVVGGIVLIDRGGSTVSPSDTSDTVASTAVATTSVPATTMPATTVPATTVPATTVPATTVPATTVLPDPSVDALAGFARLTTPAPALDDVPRLLPSAPPSAAVIATRGEWADGSPSIEEYTQTWFAEGAGATALTITTRLGEPSMVPGDGTADVLPWDSAQFGNMAPGYASLFLDDPSGSVRLWAQGALDREALVAIAQGMTLRDDGVGWDLPTLPAGLTAVYEGWYSGAASRSIVWSDASDNYVTETSAVRGVPTMFTNPLTPGATLAFVDINGVRGVSYSDPGRSAVVWSPEPGLIVTVGLYDTVDAAISLARSLAPVDEATWLAATVPLPPGSDGCHSLFC